MDTNDAVRTIATESTPSTPRTRLELRWSLRHARGRASTLISEWIVVDAADERDVAA